MQPGNVSSSSGPVAGSLGDLDNDDETYLSGTAEKDLYEYSNTDDKVKEFIGTVFLYNLTAAKIVTIRVKELDDGTYRDIDSKTYTVGTDPNPHLEFKSAKSVKVSMQIDITEGVNKTIPKSITKTDYAR
ncbi:hypothetical protein [Sulfuricurvum sp.]|uniref:hypothetical protein n=1 Tax=Sulfuricurvum sp. TaxID=2025608 RepID=UPI00356139CC